MKKLLFAMVSSVALMSAAQAADAIVEQPIVGGPYDWTGFYVGAFAGLSTGDFDYDAGLVGDPSALSLGVSGSGALGGAQIGYDWQSGAWVFGAVADIAFTSHEANLDVAIAGFGSASASSQLTYLGTVRGRVGYAFDRALLYGHGGFAYGRTEQDITVNGAEVASGDLNRTGWVLGAGLEYAVTDRISFQTEYSYVDLGRDNLYNDGVIALSEDLKFHTLKAAVNFRF